MADSVRKIDLDQTLCDADRELLAKTIPIEQLIAGRYQILSIIGEGGMGTVYHCRDTEGQREVAVKKLLPHMISDKQALNRLERESQAISSLTHPNIIEVYDFLVDGDRSPILVMQYVSGRTLHSILSEEKAMSVERSIRIAIQICQALEHAHKHNVLHRDIKPANVMLDEKAGVPDFVRVLDFGIAKVNTMDNRLTMTGEVVGTPLYISPEQIEGNAEPRSDQYAVACLLFEMLTSRPPIVGSTAIDTIVRHKTEKPPTLQEAGEGRTYPQSLEEILKKALSKDANDRYADITEFRDALAKVIRCDFAPVFSGLTRRVVEREIKDIPPPPPKPVPAKSAGEAGSANVSDTRSSVGTSSSVDLYSIDTISERPQKNVAYQSLFMSRQRYVVSSLCPPSLRFSENSEHLKGATYDAEDGVILPLGFLSFSHLPVCLPTGRLRNRDALLVCPNRSDIAKAAMLGSFLKSLLTTKNSVIVIESNSNRKENQSCQTNYSQRFLQEAVQAGRWVCNFDPESPDSSSFNLLDVSTEVFAASVTGTIDKFEKNGAELLAELSPSLLSSYQPDSNTPVSMVAPDKRDRDYLIALASIVKTGAIYITQQYEERQRYFNNSAQIDTSAVTVLPCNIQSVLRLIDDRESTIASIERIKLVNKEHAGNLPYNVLGPILRTEEAWKKGLSRLRDRLSHYMRSEIASVTKTSGLNVPDLFVRPSALSFRSPAVNDDCYKRVLSTFLYQLESTAQDALAQSTSPLPLYFVCSEFQSLDMANLETLFRIAGATGGGVIICLRDSGQIKNHDDATNLFDRVSLRMIFEGADEETIKYFANNVLRHTIPRWGLSPSDTNRHRGLLTRSIGSLNAIQAVALHSELLGSTDASNGLVMLGLEGISEIERLHYAR